MKLSNPAGAASRALLLALTLVAAASLIAGWRWWNRPPTKPEVALGQSVAEAFLDKLREGQAGEAWDAATAEFKSIEGRESFIRSVVKRPVLKTELRFFSTQDVKLHDRQRAEYIFQSPDGQQVRVLLGYEGRAWKVDRLTL